MSDVQRGFSLVEILLSVSVFALIVTALAGGLIYGQQSTALAGARSRAVMLADEGLEVVRNIRDENFSNLTDGSHGLTVSGNQWSFAGFSDTTDDIFIRAITISTVDANRKQVTSTVTWLQNAQRNGAITLITYLTNWKDNAGPTPTPTPGPTSTPTPTSALSPTPTPANCNQYCQYLYETGGSCIKSNACSTHNEGRIYECNSPDICCCQ